ncbi:MAG: hypothetical protein KAJ75_06430 [Alphaproteobacteria bacterium]|nr:hypothetical protein [Alphaproteobacteria bacterium]
MAEIKKGTDAKQSVEKFSEKGAVNAFLCGGAKMLDEKGKSIKNTVKEKIPGIKNEIKDPGLQQMAIGGAVMIAGVIASEVLAVAGLALVAEAVINSVNYKPVLLERLAKAPKDVNDLIKATMAKGRE